MFIEEFKGKYKSVPFAIYRAYRNKEKQKALSHVHREIELIAILDGVADFYIDGIMYRLKKGDVLIIPPFSVHRAEGIQGTEVSYNCICFDVELLCDKEITSGLLNRTLTLNHVVEGGQNYAQRLQERIERSCAVCEQDKSAWELDAIGNMHLIFAALKQNGHFIPAPKSSTQSTFAQKIMNYIADNYSCNITSTDAAAFIFMNPSYFCRLFKKTFGATFSDYVLTYRLEKARITLSNSAYSVTEVAFLCGFNNCSYFSKAFRQRFGTSPHKYKKRT